MKKIFISAGILCLMIIFMPNQSFTQSVAINADSSKADASAILDLKSTKKGLLIPRMTLAQRNAITAPATGLLIYQTDNTAGYYFYSGTAWLPVSTTSGGTGNDWNLNEDDNIYNLNGGYVGIGTSLPASKLYIKTPLNRTGFTHLGVTDSTQTDSLILSDKLYSSYVIGSGGFRTIVPAAASFGTDTKNILRLHAGDTSWINIIPDGSIVIGDTTDYHGYFGSKFNVKTTSGQKGVSVISDDGAIVSIIGSSTGSGIGTFTGQDMHIFTGNTTPLTATNTGYVGINNTSPKNQLEIGDVSAIGYNGNQLAFGNGINASAMAQTDNYMQLASSTNIGITPTGGLGSVGINTTNPTNTLQIGESSFGYSNTDFAINHGSGAMSILVDPVNSYKTEIFSNHELLLLPSYPSGNVGINTLTPANKLQIGNLGTAGYNGNDIAFGNGTNATGLSQNNTFLQIGSSTNIAIMPKIGIGGNVGINTTTPSAPLDVEDL